MWLTTRLMILGAVLGLPLSLLAAGEPPRRGGDRSGGDRQGTERSGSGGERSMRGPGGPGAFGDWRDTDWRQFREQLKKFCEEHSPRRWKEIEESAKAGERFSMRAAGMAMKFRALQSLEKEDKELYAIKVKQIEIEDEEFGLVQDIQSAKTLSDDAKVSALSATLREKTTLTVKLHLDERTHRIARLEKFLKKEQEKLARDGTTEAQASQAERRFQEMITQGTGYFIPKHPGKKGEPSGEGGNVNERTTPATLNAAP